MGLIEYFRMINFYLKYFLVGSETRRKIDARLNRLNNILDEASAVLDDEGSDKTLAGMILVQNILEGFDPRGPLGKSFRKAADMYSVLQNTYRLRTFSEACEALRESRIDRSVVSQWIDNKYPFVDQIKDAIRTGYPELSDALSQIRS